MNSLQNPDLLLSFLFSFKNFNFRKEKSYEKQFNVLKNVDPSGLLSRKKNFAFIIKYDFLQINFIDKDGFLENLAEMQIKVYLNFCEVKIY